MKVHVAGLVVVATAFLGCSARIQHGLDERQANELQTVLVGHGLNARKVAEDGKKPSWTIEVPSDEATQAVRILAELGLPRPAAQGFGEVFGEGSFVPSPLEERALYIRALSGEVARTLEAVDGVISARVHVVLPPAPRPGQVSSLPSKASAFLKVLPGAQEKVATLKPELKALVAGGVEGLSPDAVTFVVDEAATSAGSVVKARALTPKIRAVIVALGTLVTLMAGLILFLLLKLRKARAVAAQVRATTPSKPTRSVSLTSKAA